MQLWQDVVYAARMMRRSRGLTLAVALSIGVAIGANTAVFSIVNAVFLNPLPVSEPDRVLRIYRTAQQSPGAGLGQGLFPMSYPNFEDLRGQATGFESVAAFGFGPFNLSGGGDPEQVTGQFVSASYFPLLGIRPASGRFFTPEDDTRGGAPVVVLAHGLWTRRFGSAPDLAGRTIAVNGRRVTVVGIAPQGFHGLDTLGSSELWMPISLLPDFRTGIFGEALDRRDLRMFWAIGRLAAGVERAAVDAELDAVARRLEDAHPVVNRDRGFTTLRLSEAAINPNQRDLFVRAGAVLMGAVCLVLLIAAANVSSLLLARAAARRAEISMRLALGASRGRVVRQLLTESMLLVLVGGAVGCILALWAREILWSVRPPFLENTALDIRLDRRVLFFTAAAVGLTGLLTGLAPALQAARSNVARSLGSRSADTGTVRFGLRQVLIATQVALTVVALVGAALFLQSVRNAQRIDPGFESERLLSMAVDAGAQGYAAERRRQFHHRVVEEVSSLPGVASAALASVPPLAFGALLRVQVPGQEGVTGSDGVYVPTNTVSEGYFETLGVRVIGGRAFGPEDTAVSRRVAIVNETMAERMWPSGDAVGARFRVPFQGAPVDFEVIGIAADMKYGTLGEPPTPYFYQALSQDPAPAVTVLVRTAGAPSAMVDPVRRRIQAIDRDLPVTNAQAIGDALAQSLWAPSLGAALFGAFGLMALALAAAGIYGLIAHLVENRRAEIGLRMALGASKLAILRLVLVQTLQPVGAGLLLGGVLALLVSRLAGALLYGLTGTEPASFLAAAAILASIAALACIVPAGRALRVDPAAALRSS